MSGKLPVIVERDGPVTTVWLNRPEVRNAVDGPTASALCEAMLAFEEDADARVAVLAGQGGCFCAGADLAAAAEGEGGTRANRIETPSGDPLDPSGPMGPSRLSLSKPVIAAVAGYAVAGGLELACWCDLRIAEQSAVFGVFCRRWGVPLIDGGTVRLPRIVGQGRALDMILTGRPVSADEALTMGLANRVVADGTAVAAAQELALQIAGFPQDCLRADRESALGQFDAGSFCEAMQQEFRGGRAVLRQAVAGAARFAEGAGRHGEFD